MPKGIYQHKKGYKRPPFSEEWKRKISISHIGKPSSKKGKKLSFELIKKLSKIRKGRHFSPKSEWRKGHIPWNKDKKGEYKLPEVSRKLKEKKGKLTGNWKGGITPINNKIRGSIKYKIWQNGIFSMNGWICQRCKTKGGKLVAHHLYNFAQYPELRFAIDNGITLCKTCHEEFHKIYGKKNNTKEQIKQFLSI